MSGTSGGLADRKEQAHVGHGDKGPLLPRAGPRSVQRFGEQPLLLLGEDVVHGSVILRHEVIDGGSKLHRERLARIVAYRISSHWSSSAGLQVYVSVPDSSRLTMIVACVRLPVKPRGGVASNSASLLFRPIPFALPFWGIMSDSLPIRPPGASGSGSGSVS